MSTTHEDFNDISLSIKVEDYHSRKRDRLKSIAKRLTFQTSSLSAINEIPRPSSVPPSPREGEYQLAGHEEPVSVSQPRRRSFDVVHDTSNDQDSDTSPPAKDDNAASQEPPVDSPDDSKGKSIETPRLTKSDKSEKKDKNDGWASIGRRISFSVGMRKTRSQDRNKRELHPSPEVSQMESAEKGVLLSSASEDAPTVEVVSPSPTDGKGKDGFLSISRTSLRRPVTSPSHFNVLLSPLQAPRASYPTPKAVKPLKPTTAELNYLLALLADVTPSLSNNPFTFFKSSYQNQGDRSALAPGVPQNLWLSMNHSSRIEEWLGMFMSVETLDGENMVECHRCWKIANGKYIKPSSSSEDEGSSDEGADDAEQVGVNVGSLSVDIRNCRPKSPPTDITPFRSVALTSIPTSISTPTVYTHSNGSEYPIIPSLPTTAPSSIHESDVDALPPSVKNQPSLIIPTLGNSPIHSSSNAGPDPYPIPSLIVRSSSLPVDNTPAVAHPVPRLGQVLNHLPPSTHQSTSLVTPKPSHSSDGDESGAESDTSIATSARSVESSTSARHAPGAIAPVKKPKPVIMRSAYKRYLIDMPPPVLVIHLKRFQHIKKTHMLPFSHSKKIDDFVAFPEFLDLAPYLVPRKEDFGLGKTGKARSSVGTSLGAGKWTVKGEKCMYRLYAVVVHVGNMVCVSISVFGGELVDVKMCFAIL